ncbi:MAG: hypothetical protein ACRCSU_03680, partial [Paracoccaceae bacterium]
MRQVRIDPLSLASRKIHLAVNGNEISTGTGFFLEHNGSVYLISNLHNFTGRDIFTGKHLSNTLAE